MASGKNTQCNGNFRFSRKKYTLQLTMANTLQLTTHFFLNKPKHYWIGGIPHLWFKNYLSNSKQYVRFKRVDPQMSDIICGVPQRSVLRPLLFLICNNDISVFLHIICWWHQHILQKLKSKPATYNSKWWVNLTFSMVQSK